MAEERVADSTREPQAEQAPAASLAAPKKKKRKRSKLGLLFLLLLLALGAAAGLHFSGIWDGRPLFWSVVPRIPYVGPSLAQLFDIPARYSLTTEERRRLELEEWQRRLDERERGVLSAKAGLDALSDDLGRRAEVLDEQVRLLSESSADRSGSEATEDEKRLIDQVAKTYQDMSARNAAQIVEQLREGLAVDLLKKLPVDARASILGKMKPQRAARLTELMSGRGR